MTRTGKIARLPNDLRDQLNRRLRDGEKGKTLLKWLNALPEVRAVLAAEFNRQPINPTNLTEWKQGGHRDWLVSQDALNLARNLEDQHGLGHEALTGPFTASVSPHQPSMSTAITVVTFMIHNALSLDSWSPRMF